MRPASVVVKKDLIVLLFTFLFLVGCGAPQAAPTIAITATSPALPTFTATMPLPTSTSTTIPTPASPTAAATPTLPPGEYVNPVLDHDFPDPDAFQVGGTYYAFSTNFNGINIEAAKSTDLVHWQLLSDALPALPAWAVQDFGWAWAPDVSAAPAGNGYLMYFTARFAIRLGGAQCIGVATGQRPEGPFVSDAPQPLVCQVEKGGSIDPATFIDSDGTHYLLWKNDGNSRGGQAWIYIQKLSQDGLSLEGEPTKLITADQIWEGVLVEGPVLWERDGKYFLFYSANDYASPRYAVGYAVADRIMGPYQKASDPLLKTNLSAGIIGPGGEDIVLDANGDTWMLFHSWTAQGYRRLNLARLEWDGDTPKVTLTRDPQPAP